MLAVTIWGWASPSRLARPDYRLGAVVVYVSIVVAGICAKVCCSGLAKGVGSAPWRLQSQVQKPKCSVFMTAGNTFVHLQDCIHERQGPRDLSEGGPTPINLGNLPDVRLYSMEQASCYGFGNHSQVDVLFPWLPRLQTQSVCSLHFERVKNDPDMSVDHHAPRHLRPRFIPVNF